MPTQSAIKVPLEEVFLTNFPNATAMNLSLFMVTNQRTNKLTPDDIPALASLIQSVNFGVKVYKVQDKTPAPGQRVLVKTTTGYVFTAVYDLKDNKPYWDVHANVGKSKLGEVEFWIPIEDAMFPVASKEKRQMVMPITMGNNGKPSNVSSSSISSEAHLRKLIEQDSFTYPVVLFKYKPSCNIGKTVNTRLREQWSDELPTFNYMNLADSMELGRQAAELLNMKHESPQIFIVWQGEAYWEASLYSCNNMMTIRNKMREIVLSHNLKSPSNEA